MVHLTPIWRERAPTRRLLEAFPDPTSVRFVGGCVRDALLGVDSSDLDLATTLTPQEVMDCLTIAGLKPLPTGIEHGTVTVFIEGERFEITTLRRDVETDGRRAVVAFSQDWREDASRRDFTFNALYLDTQGELFDPWDGVCDLEKGHVRFIGDPGERVREDALRILRFFRFVARFQKGPLDPLALAICQQHRDLLSTLSRERVGQEICLLLGEKKAHALFDVLSLMTRLRVWEALFELTPDTRLWKKGLTLEGQNASGPCLRRRLALIFWPTPRALETLRLPRTLINDVEKIHKAAAQESDLRVVLYELGRELGADWLFLRHTLGLLPHSTPSTLSQGCALLDQEVPPFPLTGHDLQPYGIFGPDLGRVLKYVQRWWAQENFTPSKQDCLDHGLGHFQALQKNVPSTTGLPVPQA